MWTALDAPVFTPRETRGIGPMQDEAERGAAALAGVDSTALASLAQRGAETGSIWLLMVIAVLNVALGVWRPRLSWRRE